MLKINFTKIQESPELAELVSNNELIQEKLTDLKERIQRVPDDYVLTRNERKLLIKLNQLIDYNLTTEHLWEKLLTKIQIQCKFSYENSTTSIQNELNMANKIIDNFLNSGDVIRKKSTKRINLYLIGIRGGIIALVGLSLWFLERFLSTGYFPSFNEKYIPLNLTILFVIQFLFVAVYFDVTEEDFEDLPLFNILPLIIVNLVCPSIVIFTVSITMIILAVLFYIEKNTQFGIGQTVATILLNDFDVYLPNSFLETNIPDDYWSHINNAINFIDNEDAEHDNEISALIKRNIDSNIDKIVMYGKIIEEL